MRGNNPTTPSNLIMNTKDLKQVKKEINLLLDSDIPQYGIAVYYDKDIGYVVKGFRNYEKLQSYHYMETVAKSIKYEAQLLEKNEENTN